jgi:hypothetical protein
MSDHIKDLLLEDYRYRTESLWKNEETGETRVNLVTGLITLGIGAIIMLATNEKGALEGEVLRLLILTGLFSLLVLSFITMLRMITRNEKTDLAKRQLDLIRQVFKDLFDDEHKLIDYHLFRVSSLSEQHKKKKSLQLRKFGGLAHTMAAINSLLFAGMLGAAIFPIHSWGNTQEANSIMLVCVGALLAFVLSLYLQVAFIRFREARAPTLAGLPTHAGGVVFNQNEGYLLVRPKKGGNDWVLPKGHIEKGEEHGETALREVLEEGGVTAQLICFVDRIRYEFEGKKVDVKCYLIGKSAQTDHLISFNREHSISL